MIERKAIYTKDAAILKRAKIDWDFHEEETQPHLHALHPYPARFIPQIPRQAILNWSKEGDLVLDPFCGCGTTLLESVLLKRPCIGIDNNAVACLVSKAKTAEYNKKDKEALIDFENKLNDIIKTSSDLQLSIPEYQSIEYWFDKKAILDLGKLRWTISQLPKKPQLLAMAVLSAIIVNVSYQDSDTRYSRKVTHYNQGHAIKFYKKKLKDVLSRLEEIRKTPREKCEVRLGDSRNLTWITNNSIKLIVTSPPYLNAYDYHKYHRHRLHWINGDINIARDIEIGKHDDFSRPEAKPDQYFKDMSSCFEEWHRVLSNQRRALIVVGDAIVSGKPVSVGDEFIRICKEIGFEIEDHWIRKINKNKKSFNRQARIDEEHLILLRKSS